MEPTFPPESDVQVNMVIFTKETKGRHILFLHGKRDAVVTALQLASFVGPRSKVAIRIYPSPRKQQKLILNSKFIGRIIKMWKNSIFMTIPGSNQLLPS